MKRVLTSQSFEFPIGYFALTAENRLFSRALIELICRKIAPQSGHIIRRGRISWPLGHAAPFSAVVTGKQAVSHISVLYGVSRQQTFKFVKENFSHPELLHTPMQKWQARDRSELLLWLALVPDFDVMIVDTSLVFTHSTSFSKRYLELFMEKTRGKTVLISPNQARFTKLICKSAIHVSEGKISVNADLEWALKNNNLVTLQKELAQEEDTNLDTLEF
ncbi:hypothetical protein Q4544_15495 [Cognatishimia sp. 1_MG-2023]|uniref:hypothetical protein n=1 Tax=Cognatishimia sp. 1_MG-2023 TaxID=3062642 RepID=UPI0026E199F8|nr:hypothetical protein [Cognatishimia sp. 1_MG-2023]MDO6728344.1 hypothetical protein [Cognatishimia sp. 1_MG-2023]